MFLTNHPSVHPSVKFSGIIFRMSGRNEFLFGIMMYHEDLQNVIYFGYVSLILLFLAVK